MGHTHRGKRSHRGKRNQSRRLRDYWIQERIKAKIRREARSQSHYDVLTRELINLWDYRLHEWGWVIHWQGEVLEDTHNTGSFQLIDMVMG